MSRRSKVDSAYDLENACFTSYCGFLESFLKDKEPGLASSEELEQKHRECKSWVLDNFNAEGRKFKEKHVTPALDSLKSVMIEITKVHRKKKL